MNHSVIIYAVSPDSYVQKQEAFLKRPGFLLIVTYSVINRQMYFYLGKLVVDRVSINNYTNLGTVL